MKLLANFSVVCLFFEATKGLSETKWLNIPFSDLKKKNENSCLSICCLKKVNGGERKVQVVLCCPVTNLFFFKSFCVLVFLQNAGSQLCYFCLFSQWCEYFSWAPRDGLMSYFCDVFTVTHAWPHRNIRSVKMHSLCNIPLCTCMSIPHLCDRVGYFCIVTTVVWGVCVCVCRCVLFLSFF